MAQVGAWIAKVATNVFFSVAVATNSVMIGNIAAWATQALIIGTPLYLAGKALMPKMPDLNSMLSKGQMVRTPVGTRKIIYGQTRVGGNILYMAEGTSGVASNREHLYMVTAMAYGECEEIVKFYANNDELTLTARSGYPTVFDVTTPSRYVVDSTGFRFTFYGNDMLGTTTQTLSTAITANSELTSSDQFKGICCLQFVMTYDPEVFVSGIPNVTADIKGRKLYDIRDGSTSWSDNPALAIYDYLTSTSYGLGVPSSRIDSTSFAAAANLCDETVTLTSGTEKRYTINGVIDTANSVKANLETMLSTLGGSLTYIDGKYKLYGSDWRAPTQTIGEDDLRGDIQLITKPSRRDQFNTVKGVFIGADNVTNGVAADYPAVIDSAAVAADGETIVAELPLPLTNSVTMCERLAKIYLLKSRQPYTMTLPLKLTKFQLEPPDTVSVTLSSLGFKNKYFEVMDWRFGTTAGDNGEASIGIDVTLRETASSVYDWDSSEEIGYTETDAPTATKIYEVATPTFSLAAVSTKKAGDGTLIDGVEVSVTDDTDNRHITEYDIAWKKSTDANFETISVLRDSN